MLLVGLGGTDKTQLARRYIAQHKARYDTVLWLDVRNDTTTISSFERCCGALSIALEKRPTDGLLHDAPAVQKLLNWLAAREKDQKWLVVFDNADQLDQLALLIPQNGLAGSVMITRQDGKAVKLVHRAKCTKVDKMEIDESKALLARSMDIDLSKASSGLTSSLEKLIDRLDSIALALDLASARIRDDVDNSFGLADADTEGAAIDAIEQYLVDLEEHSKSMWSDSEHNAVSEYQKTISSVWETVLSSVESSEKRDSDTRGYTMHLLRLAVILGPTVVHREVFRAASQSLADVCPGFSVDVPQWFKDFLKVSQAGFWDSFAYRRSVARLMRFNLVHPASQDVHSQHVSQFDNHPETVSWPGFTIHGLVRWCTGSQAPEAEYEVCRVALVWACCRTWNECDDGIDFRPALFEYILQRSKRPVIGYTENGFADSYFAIGTTLARVRDFNLAGACLEVARDSKVELFGENSSETMCVGVELGRFYLLRSLSHDNPVDGNVDAVEAERVLRPIRAHTEGRIRIAAAS